MTGKNIPSDLSLVVGLVLLTDIFVLVPGLSETFIRTVLGLPMVLFLPGYALIAALFPAREDLDGIERVALSFGLSIAVVPLIGLGLNYTPWGIRLLPILISISVFTLLMCGAAYYRRGQLPEGERFEVAFRKGAEALRAEVLEKPESKLDRALTIILLISILASVATLAYVIVTPKEGEHFTEFYILGPEGMADNYPTRYTLGESGTVIIGVVNHEYRPVNYSLEVRLENRTLPLPADLRQVRLAHNATWEKPLTIAPPFEGTDMKLQFLLYNDTDREVPYRDLHLWIDVNSTETAGQAPTSPAEAQETAAETTTGTDLETTMGTDQETDTGTTMGTDQETDTETTMGTDQETDTGTDQEIGQETATETATETAP